MIEYNVEAKELRKMGLEEIATLVEAIANDPKTPDSLFLQSIREDNRYDQSGGIGIQAWEIVRRVGEKIPEREHWLIRQEEIWKPDTEFDLAGADVSVYKKLAYPFGGEGIPDSLTFVIQNCESSGIIQRKRKYGLFGSLNAININLNPLNHDTFGQITELNTVVSSFTGRKRRVVIDKPVKEYKGSAHLNSLIILGGTLVELFSESPRILSQAA